VNSSSTDLVLANAATSLAVATDFSEVKHVRDVAETIRTFYMKVGKTLEEQNKATELKLRAERQLGQMLATMELGQGKRTDLVACDDEVRDKRKTLKELDVTKSQSSRWQMIAKLTDDEFQSYITEHSGEKDELTTAGMLRYAKSLRQMVIDVPFRPADPLPAPFFSSFEEARSSLPQFSCVHVNPNGIPRHSQEVRAFGEESDADTIDMLSKIPIKEITSPNAHLHLWTPDNLLNDACWLITHWGFTLAGSFVWIKPVLGPGPYWRTSHELMLTAVRGELPFKHHSLRSWQQLSPGIDGEKPEEIRRLIEAASPGPYLELFGCQAVPGWVVLSGPRQSNGSIDHGGTSTVEVTVNETSSN
jgi:N6-adenosine-specific RNA methylase IME4